MRRRRRSGRRSRSSDHDRAVATARPGACFTAIRTPRPITMTRQRLLPSISVALVGGLLCAAVPSCTVGPNYRRPDQQMPTTFRSPATQAASGTLGRDWWRLFGDPTLDGLINDARQANTNVQAAMARVAQARGRRRGSPAASSSRSSRSSRRSRGPRLPVQRQPRLRHDRPGHGGGEPARRRRPDGHHHPPPVRPDLRSGHLGPRPPVGRGGIAPRVPPRPTSRSCSRRLRPMSRRTISPSACSTCRRRSSPDGRVLPPPARPDEQAVPRRPGRADGRVRPRPSSTRP